MSTLLRHLHRRLFSSNTPSVTTAKIKPAESDCPQRICQQLKKRMYQLDHCVKSLTVQEDAQRLQHQYRVTMLLYQECRCWRAGKKSSASD